MSQSKRVLLLVGTNYWGRLTPALQSTAAGDTLLGNAFEPLVDLSKTGGVTSGAAAGWEVNDDSTVFIFRIRPTARFSDGSNVTAGDFVRSWLDSVVSPDIDSEQPNTLDVLYKVRGFSKAAARTGKVPGLTAVDDLTLRIEFAEPFRTALFELTGTRYAAWKKDPISGRAIGSGIYQIVEEVPQRLVRYKPNPYSEKPARYDEVILNGFEDAWAEMFKGKADGYLGKDPSDALPSNIRQSPGSVVGHLNLFVSGVTGGLFSNAKHRKALLYLIHRSRSCSANAATQLGLGDGLDPQIYPSFWPGRLDDSEVKATINLGEQWVEELVEATTKHPIRFAYNNVRARTLLGCLEDQGLRFDAASYAPVSGDQYLATAYGKRDYDIAMVGTNVVGSDPDSIYHLLGQRGALHSLPIHRDHVSRLLENGRAMKRTADLHTFYKKVSMSVLEEVPLIHLGYLRSQLYINTDRIDWVTAANNSDRFSFNNLQPR